MMFAKLLKGLVYGVLVVLSITAATPTLAACPTPNPRNNVFVNIDADVGGNVDAVAVMQAGIRFSLMGNSVPVVGYLIGPYYGTRGTFFADATGDGQADAIVVNDWGITVRAGNGFSLDPNKLWTIATFNDYFYGTIATYFADVTGDGKADAIAVDTTGVRVRVSNGSQFLPVSITTGPYNGDRGTYFADITGDGKAEMIRVNNGGISAMSAVYNPSTNVGLFTASYPWTTDAYYGDRGTYFADVDGDGKADAIVVNSSGPSEGITVRFSTGSVFAPFNPTRNPNRFRGTGTYFGSYFVDMNKDRKADAILVTGSEIRVLNSIGGSTGLIFGNDHVIHTGNFTSDLCY